MPNCIRFTPKDSKEPIKLQALDALIAAYIGEPVHESRWTVDWFNSLGFMFAMGKTVEYMRDSIAKNEWYNPDNKLEQVLDYLVGHYTWEAWYQVGR